MEDKDLLVLNCHYLCCWWPGDQRSQGISSRGINSVCPKEAHPTHTQIIMVRSSMLSRFNSRGQYPGCWCPGSLRRQDISSHGIDYVELGPGLTWERISSTGTCVISMWSNDIKCKYMFMFPLKNLARKELTHVSLLCSSCHIHTPNSNNYWNECNPQVLRKMLIFFQ